MQVQVAAGVAQEISTGKGGAAVIKPFRAIAQFGDTAESGSDPLAPPPLPDRPKPDPQTPAKEPHLRGFYGLVAASLFAPGVEPTDLGDESPVGKSLGVQLGYRLITAVGFEVMFDYGNVSSTGPAVMTSTTRAYESEYEASSFQSGGNVRFMTPERRARFVATLGFGLTYDSFSLTKYSGASSTGIEQSTSSTNLYFNTEQGVEFNVREVLIGLVVQQTVGTVGSLREGNLGLEGNTMNLGVGLRLGYSSW